MRSLRSDLKSEKKKCDKLLKEITKLEKLLKDETKLKLKYKKKADDNADILSCMKQINKTLSSKNMQRDDDEIRDDVRQLVRYAEELSGS